MPVTGVSEQNKQYVDSDAGLGFKKILLVRRNIYFMVNPAALRAWRTVFVSETASHSGWVWSSNLTKRRQAPSSPRMKRRETLTWLV